MRVGRCHYPNSARSATSRPLYEVYVLNDGSFAGCVGRADARRTITGQKPQLEEMLSRKWESDHYSGLLEHVADALATRNPDYASGLDSNIVSSFDPPDHVTQRRSERMFVALFSFVLAEQAYHPMQFLTTIGRSFPTSRRGPVRRTVRHLRH